MKPKSLIGCGLVVALISCFLCCGGGLFLRMRDEAATKEQLVEAHRLWGSGQKAEAVSKYKSVLNKNLLNVPSDSEKSAVYQRVIDFEVEQGNVSEAKAILEKALDNKVSLSSDNEATNQLVAQVRADREAREKKSQEDKEAGRAEKEKAAAQAKVEAARKAEEEFDANGLVLLRKTVNSSDGEITGTVVNRRNKKLSYAQITFNLYDASGAQVGTALANINGLEPGGRWNFKASSLGNKDVSRYKFSELSGF